MMKKLQILSLDRDSDTSIAQVPTVISSENRVEEKGGEDTTTHRSHLLMLQNATQVKLIQNARYTVL